MFTRLGHLAVRRRRLVLAFTVLFIVAAGAGGVGVFGALDGAGLSDPGSESYRARQFLEDDLGVRKHEAILLVQAAGGGADTDDVDDPAVTEAATRLTDSVRADGHVASVSSYWSLGDGDPRRATLRSTDGSAALIVLDLAGTAGDVKDAVVAIRDRYAGTHGPITVGVGGAAAIDVAIGDQLDTDLIRAESLAVPVTLALLVLVFAGVVAAALPLAVATVSVTGAFLVLFAISRVTDVSAYSINLTTGLSFALAIDYSLFIVTRFREELVAGRSSDEAVVRTVETAGRTVAVSALTVAASLSALLVFPLYFLRSFAYAGIAVVVVAAAGSLLSLPALLAVLGPRVNTWSLRRRRDRRRFWHRLSSLVMRRPVPVATGVVFMLLLIGAPFLRVNPGLPSYQALPPSSEARQVADALATQFTGNHSDQFAIVLPGVAADDATGFADDVRNVHGVAAVAVQQAEAGTWLTVTPSVPLRSAAGEDLVRDLRDLDAPFAFGVEGRAAELVDTKAAIYDRLPIALGIIGLATVVLLFAAFGSVLVPVKAVVLNLLSLTATFGAMVWVFQDGHLSGVLGFTATGQLDVAMPILMFCIAFGLSIDYEVFLLSRIKEEYDHIGDNTRAVATGLEKTGPLVTAAAAVLAVSFTGFAVAGMSFMKLMGIGLALAIVMDATVIRGLLVPAFMHLAGTANWWAPAPLRRLHQRWGLTEARTAPGEAATP
nr:MMPL family transporter [Dactylosporangium thailandense]